MEYTVQLVRAHRQLRRRQATTDARHRLRVRRRWSRPTTTPLVMAIADINADRTPRGRQTSATTTAVKSAAKWTPIVRTAPSGSKSGALLLGVQHRRQVLTQTLHCRNPRGAALGSMCSNFDDDIAELAARLARLRLGSPVDLRVLHGRARRRRRHRGGHHRPLCNRFDEGDSYREIVTQRGREPTTGPTSGTNFRRYKSQLQRSEDYHLRAGSSVRRTSSSCRTSTRACSSSIVSDPDLPDRVHGALRLLRSVPGYRRHRSTSTRRVLASAGCGLLPCGTRAGSATSAPESTDPERPGASAAVCLIGLGQVLQLHLPVAV